MAAFEGIMGICGGSFTEERQAMVDHGTSGGVHVGFEVHETGTTEVNGEEYLNPVQVVVGGVPLVLEKDAGGAITKKTALPVTVGRTTRRLQLRGDDDMNSPLPAPEYGPEVTDPNTGEKTREVIVTLTYKVVATQTDVGTPADPDWRTKGVSIVTPGQDPTVT